MSSVSVFWWAPRRSLQLARPELRPHGRAWIRLGLRSGRPLLNFGDELSRSVVAEVLGTRVGWRSARTADLVAIGSVFELAARDPSPIAVWGTGLRQRPDAIEAAGLLSRVGPVLAVRGPQTRDALGLPADTVLGDPGLLAYRQPRRRRPAGARRGTVLIPHFTQWNSAAGRGQIHAATRIGMTVVDPSQSPARVLAAIAGAEFVYSASLHGVIVAHALGTPAQLVRDGSSVEPLWKYQDYYASMGEPVAWSTWPELTSADHRRRTTADRADRVEALADRAEELGEGLVGALRAWRAGPAHRADRVDR